MEANNLKPFDTRKAGLKLTTNQNGYKAEVRLLTMILRKFKHLHGALLPQLCRMLMMMNTGM
jgi:hypothetical protein